MAPFFVKPENALKRAQELIAVNQPATASQLLVDVLGSKRARGAPVGVMEPIMLCLVDLCVASRKGRVLKDALYSYKSGQQKQGVATIEVVLSHYLTQAQAKVEEAQAKAQALLAATPAAAGAAAAAGKDEMEGIEDLEATETPESILLSTVSSEGHKDRMDREVVTPWVKFLWESYRTALDILRNNVRLEVMYQTVVHQAFGFCLKYARKTEFRRLCDMLRQHLTTAAKYTHQAHGISLDDPETLNRHLDIRFGQLNAAAEMEQWQEAFRSIEDIFNLFSLSSLPPKSFMLANYYEKLARIFWVGDNVLFHAAAWQKYYALARQFGDLPPEEVVRMSNVVVMSALAIPLRHSRSALGSEEQEGSKKSAARLAALCKMSSAPSRASVLREATQPSIFAHAMPALQELHRLVEVEFSPLTFSTRVDELLETVKGQKDLAKYFKPLQQVLLTRLLQQLSDVYSVMPMDTLVDKLLFTIPNSVATAAGVDGLDAMARRPLLEAWVEKFVLQSCKDGNVHIRIDHQRRSLTFEDDVFHTVPATVAAELSTHRVRLSMSKLSQGLAETFALIQQAQRQQASAPAPAANAFVASALANMKGEMQKRAERIQLIERRKVERERALAAQEAKERETRAIQARALEEAERQRIAEEVRQRELMRFEATKRQVELAENRKLAENLTADQKRALGNLDEAGAAERLVAMQIAALTKEKEALAAKVTSLTKRVDYTHRAMIRAEIPLLKEAFEREREEARAAHEAAYATLQQRTRAQWEAAISSKARLTAIRPEYDAFTARVSAERKSTFAAAKAQAAAALALAKGERVRERVAHLQAERKRRLMEEAAAAEVKRREEEEAAAVAREAAEKEAKLQAERERLASLDASAERQRRREAEIEAKLSGSSALGALKSSEGAWKSSRAREGAATARPLAVAPPAASKASPAPAPAAGAAPAASTGKYVPPSRRNK